MARREIVNRSDDAALDGTGHFMEQSDHADHVGAYKRHGGRKGKTKRKPKGSRVVSGGTFAEDAAAAAGAATLREFRAYVEKAAGVQDPDPSVPGASGVKQDSRSPLAPGHARPVDDLDGPVSPRSAGPLGRGRRRSGSGIGARDRDMVPPLSPQSVASTPSL